MNNANKVKNMYFVIRFKKKEKICVIKNNDKYLFLVSIV